MIGLLIIVVITAFSACGAGGGGEDDGKGGGFLKKIGRARRYQYPVRGRCDGAFHEYHCGSQCGRRKQLQFYR